MFSFKSIIISISLFFFIISCSDNPSDNQAEEHVEAVGFLLKSDADTIAYQLEGKDVVGELTLLSTDTAKEFQLQFYSEAGELFIPEDHDHEHGKKKNEEEFKIQLTIVDTTIFSYEQEEHDEGEHSEGEEEAIHLHIKAKKVGTTNFKVEVIHGDHADFSSKSVTAIVKNNSK